MLSVVVNFFNNQREAKNTLYSLTSQYQKFDDFEVIAIDNGSSQPLDESEVKSFGPQFQYRYIQNALTSPAAAINAACRDAKGSHIVIMIDGAHILSPGVFALMQKAFKLFNSTFVATTPFHLGPMMQNDRAASGYDQVIEDKLMASVNWKENGYRLFTLAAECADMSKGWFGCLFESGCFGMRRDEYLAMGGLNEKFTSPGGGMVNLDMLHRATSIKDMEYVVMIGEGSFHQYHGGVATSAAWNFHPWEKFHAEYEEICHKPYFRNPRVPFFMGTMRVHSLETCKKTAVYGIRLWEEEFVARPQEIL